MTGRSDGGRRWAQRTQPICAARWNQDYATTDRPGSPFSTRGTVDVGTDETGSGELERCCYCNRPTRCGIYVRVDPTTVPFPATEVDQ